MIVKFNLKAISIPITLADHIHRRDLDWGNKRTEGSGDDGGDRKQVSFEALQGVNVETEVFC